MNTNVYIKYGFMPTSPLGKSNALPHPGNRTFQEDDDLSPELSNLADLRTRLDITKYPRPTIYIVSLLVLEHQCHMHSLLNAPSTN
jgi:hypothetical protein